MAYLYSTNLLEIWYMIPEKNSAIMYQIPRRLDLNYFNYNQTRFQINERLYINNADPGLHGNSYIIKYIRKSAGITQLWCELLSNSHAEVDVT